MRILLALETRLISVMCVVEVGSTYIISSAVCIGKSCLSPFAEHPRSLQTTILSLHPITYFGGCWWEFMEMVMVMGVWSSNFHAVDEIDVGLSTYISVLVVLNM
jgi:hypothetical protein